MYHNPVLLNECIEGLAINPEGIYVDATFGGGGHARAILSKLTTGRLIAFDQDADALRNTIDDSRFTFINQNFKFLINFLRLYKALPVDGILADLGISSHQIDQPDRGFSTRYEAELDLRMNRDSGITASEVLNTYSIEELKRIFVEYGELKNAYKIAQKIDFYRTAGSLTTTTQLKSILTPLAERGRENKFFARVFQAIRIEVNGELDVLRELLLQTQKVIKPGGRLVIMSYHSLEDRLVKNYMKSGNFEGIINKDFYGNPVAPFKPITRKPVVPGEAENDENSRARSAKLRIAERLNDE